MNGPRPIVGSDYRPARFEHRTPLEYRALRPEHSLDADRLQSAMLPRPLRWIAPPLVDRPIEADIDETGALYVSNSSGSNDPAQKQLETRPHSILKLRDVDGDGVFETLTVFADGLMCPEGVMWRVGSL